MDKWSRAWPSSTLFADRILAARAWQVLKWLIRDLGDAFPGIESRPAPTPKRKSRCRQRERGDGAPPCFYPAFLTSLGAMTVAPGSDGPVRCQVSPAATRSVAPHSRAIAVRNAGYIRRISRFWDRRISGACRWYWSPISDRSRFHITGCRARTG